MAFTLRLPDDLTRRVDEARGDVPRSVWIRRLLEQYLDGVEFTAGSVERAPKFDAPQRPSRERPLAGRQAALNRSKGL